MQKKEFADPEILADGKVLIALKQQFIKEKTDEALFLFMTCLRDSVVYVPMLPLMSEEDRKRMEQGDTICGSMLFRPDILPHPNGMHFFPLFTQKGQIPKEYLEKGIVPLPMSVIRAVKLAMEYGTDSLVIDPYTQPCAIPLQAASKIADLPSALSEDDRQSLE